MSDLCVIVPSRGRPQNIADLVRWWDDMTSNKARLLVVVDDDDPELLGYLELGLSARAPGIDLWSLPPRGSMVGALNQAVRLLGPSDVFPSLDFPFALGFMGDDHRPRTPGWDLDVVAELRRLGMGIVTGRDGFREDHLPTWCAMTSNIVKILGYMAPPGLVHIAVDNAWMTLGSALGAFSYLPHVLVEHMHPFAGKAQMDAGYARVNAGSMYERDLAEFERWIRDDLPGAVAKLTGRSAGVD